MSADKVRPFWESKQLHELNQEQWESLCDGCGKCCLHKLEDEDDGEVYYTNVACRLLNIDSCRCSDYSNRLDKVPGCLSLKASDVAKFEWLPSSCAYRLLSEGQSLPDWHPLITGDANIMHRGGMSVSRKVVSEETVHEDDHEEHVIHWID